MRIKRSGILLIATVILAGCSEPTSVEVVETSTGKPAVEVLVQRERPPNRWERITNSVGAFYHSYWVVESHWTDAKGRCSLKRIGMADGYGLITTSSLPLTVIVGTNSIALYPGTNVNLKAYYYALRRGPKGIEYSVQEPWWYWDKDKPNRVPMN